MASYDSDKGLISKIYKEFVRLKNNNNNNNNNNKSYSFKTWAEDLNGYFPLEDIQIANKYVKRCSTSLPITKVQIKTTMRHHLTPVTIAIINRTDNNKCWRGCRKKKSSYSTGGGTANWYSHYRKQYGSSAKN